MISLVFGFFFAVCLLLLCLWAFGILVESGALWFILGGLVILAIWLAVQDHPVPPQQACIDNVRQNRMNYVGSASTTTLDQAQVKAENICRAKNPTPQGGW